MVTTTLSIVMIVKDEAHTLPDCLSAAHGIGDELVIVDTGSQDDTIAIARRYTDNISHFQWIDDFAAARNAALEQATGDWCLILDADEVIENPSAAKQMLLRFIETQPAMTLGTLERTSPSGPSDQDPVLREHISRLFHRSHFRYRGAIHEQLAPTAKGEAVRVSTGVKVHHSGYRQDIEDETHKARRNIPLLEKVLQTTPDDEYYLYQLGQAHFSIKAYPAAIDAFESAEGAIDFTGDLPRGKQGPVSREVLTTIITSLCYSYINVGNLEKAQALMLRHLNHGHAGTQRADVAHALGYVHFMMGKANDAIEAYTLSLQFGPTQEDVLGTGSFSSHYHIGLCQESLGNPIKALEHYANAIHFNPRYQPAINRCLGFIVDYQTLPPKDLFNLSPVENWEPLLIEKIKECHVRNKTDSTALLLQAAAMLSDNIHARAISVLSPRMDLN